jgi:hypothetical protein
LPGSDYTKRIIYFLILVSVLVSAIPSVISNPYSHVDTRHGLIMQDYPNVTINHSYDRKMPAPVVKAKRSKGARRVESGNSSMNNSSAPNKSIGVEKKGGIMYGIR